MKSEQQNKLTVGHGGRNRSGDYTGTETIYLSAVSRQCSEAAVSCDYCIITGII